ncbi:hypothetical protein C2845_PM04G16000 [Panicum miliaceum]|uniref:Uncharacterized protein n=1 Tax=Panicum miliaceum TaxID=4540 RepID=A0A3L6QX79_PANMI|nr:hypothetical protein C2845_PM04G16000 [Panicum miliaceum]
MEVEAVSCECCGLEECMGEYTAGVGAYFEGWWLLAAMSGGLRSYYGNLAGNLNMIITLWSDAQKPLH